MKNIFLLIALHFSFIVIAQTPQNGCTGDEKIKSIKKMLFTYTDGKVAETGRLSALLKFDRDCRLSGETYYNTVKNIISIKNYYKYSPEGKIFEVICTGSEGNGIIAYDYNEKENNTKRVLYSSTGNTEWKKILEYDDNGNNTTITKLISTGSNAPLTKIALKISYSYDSKNNLIEEIHTDEKGNEIISKSFSYNDKNKITETIIKDLVATGKMVCTYNDKNFAVEKHYFRNEKQIKKVIIEYNDNDLVTKETEYDAEDNPSYHILYEYTFYE